MARSDRHVTVSGGSSRSIVWPHCCNWSAMTIGMESRRYCSSTMKHRYIFVVVPRGTALGLSGRRGGRPTERRAGVGTPLPPGSIDVPDSGVVFRAEVRDQLFAHHPAQRVLQLHRL